MATFSIKNWDKFQHYKDRNPPWIRLHNTVLEDYEIGRLQDASKAHLFAIWLLASRLNNVIPYDAKWIAGKINANTPVDLEAFEKHGLIVVERNASTAQAKCSPEGETETEADTPSLGANKKPSRSKEKTRLPENWKPTPEDANHARKSNLTAAETAKLAERFKRYWLGDDAPRPRKSDWHKTWCNWVDDDAPKIIRQRVKPSANRQGPVGIVATNREILADLDRLNGGDGNPEADETDPRGRPFDGPEVGGFSNAPNDQFRGSDLAHGVTIENEQQGHDSGGREGSSSRVPSGIVTVPGGRGAQSSDDTGRGIGVVAELERTQNKTGFLQPGTAEAVEDLSIPGFLKRTA